MRLRYLLLGLFLAVPTATVIHIWPQRPEYCIEGGRQYLADDPAQRQLLFFRDERRKAGLPPVIERYDADSGRLTSNVQLRLESPNPKLAMDDNAVISSDLKTISVFNWVEDETRRYIGMTGFIFEVATGNRRPGEFTFGQFDRKGFSPSGRWFALVHELGLVVIDTQTCRTHFEVASPTAKYVSTGVYFSPDSGHLLYQWQVDGEAGRIMHLVNLETSQEEATFSLPEGRKLCEWRPNELRCYESLPRQPDGLMPVHRYRHAFDGKTLGPGTADSLLDCTDWVLLIPNLAIDTESWVGQFEMYPPRQPDWVKLLDKAESMGLVKMFGPRPPNLAGCVRIIDRATNKVRFERHVPSVHQCRLALDGKLLIVDNKPGIALTGGLGLGTAAPEPPPAPFEIYRTDGWPRWIWTALGVFVILTTFALFGRWRHVVIRRRSGR